MKTKCLHFIMAVLLLLSSSAFAQSAADFSGAYEMKEGSTTHMLIFSDEYYVHAAFDMAGKKFVTTEGGPFKIENKNLIMKIEFNSDKKERVDSIFTFPLTIANDFIEVSHNGRKLKFTQVDDGKGSLVGNWQISGRMQQGKFSPMAAGARKTIKILSGKRFQWIAFNASTKEFFGTGGGSYTYENGNYTEKIEFFPRDSTRVGSSLSFADRTEDGEWYHTGKSSNGEALFEVWKKASRID